MKNILSTTAVLAAMTAGNTASAQGMTGDWYGSVFGGYSVSSDAESSLSYGPYTVELSQELDAGYILGVTVGMSVAPNLRVEAELSYSKYENGDVTVGYFYAGTLEYSGTYPGGDGEAAATYLMGNMWLDLPDVSGSSGVVPYVGGGIGGVNIEITGDGTSENDRVLAYQVGAGVQIQAGAGMIDIGYRFKGTGKPNFSVDIDGDTVNIEADNLYSNNLQVGYVMKF